MVDRYFFVVDEIAYYEFYSYVYVDYCVFTIRRPLGRFTYYVQVLAILTCYYYPIAAEEGYYAYFECQVMYCAPIGVYVYFRDYGFP